MGASDGRCLELVGLQVCEVDAGGAPHPSAVAFTDPGERGVAGVRVQQHACAGKLDRHLLPQRPYGLRGVRARLALEYAVEAGVEDALPPALGVDEETAEALLAVLALDRLVPCGQCPQATRVHVVEHVLDEPEPSSGAFRCLGHGSHLLNDGNIHCVCL
jgi:hypothetical protein